jgi:hypothetical protein
VSEALSATLRVGLRGLRREGFAALVVDAALSAGGFSPATGLSGLMSVVVFFAGVRLERLGFSGVATGFASASESGLA